MSPIDLFACIAAATSIIGAVCSIWTLCLLRKAIEPAEMLFRHGADISKANIELIKNEGKSFALLEYYIKQNKERR